MLFDIKRVKENKIRSRETRSSNFLLKRVFSDMESRILDLPDAWEHGLIEGCRGIDLKELNKNNKIIISEYPSYVNILYVHFEFNLRLSAPFGRL